MGGCGALRLAFKYPDMFCAVSSVAGAVVNWEEEHMTNCTTMAESLSLPGSTMIWNPLVFLIHIRLFLEQTIARIISSSREGRTMMWISGTRHLMMLYSFLTDRLFDLNQINRHF